MFEFRESYLNLTFNEMDFKKPFHESNSCKDGLKQELFLYSMQSYVFFGKSEIKT